MRGALLLSALEVLENAVYPTAEFLGVLLTTSKGDYRALRRFSPSARVTLAETLREFLKERERFYKLLHRMERDGLVEKTEDERWKLTKRGKTKWRNLLKRFDHALPVASYRMKPGAEILILSFDIPERERRKRDWLRSVLTRLNFTLLHQSTWIGKGILPRTFIKDLREINLLSHVAIFSINKRGTISQFTG
ncbi:hypothetical protein HY478_03520 [Candidatus Uhrbacteria bacterium]|nr:hypothetical protein [Candidatus Uhrbacteria bacterium]